MKNIETVKIGNQVWMKHDLRVTKFRNGDYVYKAPGIDLTIFKIVLPIIVVIFLIVDAMINENAALNTVYVLLASLALLLIIKPRNFLWHEGYASHDDWVKACEKNKPAWYTTYDNLKEKKLGFHYNWFAINDPRGLAPEGFHIPSDEEWKELVFYVKMNGLALKSREGWDNNRNGTDDFGFSALPAGLVATDGTLLYQGEYCKWWSTTWNSTNMKIDKDANSVNSNWPYVESEFLESRLGAGFCVRCIKD
jgi:uncharacterized protein (TIGR02145 family)